MPPNSQVWVPALRVASPANSFFPSNGNQISVTQKSNGLFRVLERVPDRGGRRIILSYNWHIRECSEMSRINSVGIQSAGGCRSPWTVIPDYTGRTVYEMSLYWIVVTIRNGCEWNKQVICLRNCLGGTEGPADSPQDSTVLPRPLTSK